MARNLQTVPTFCQTRPFTPAQVRWWVFQAEQNGMQKAGAIVRIGRRVYLDVDAFERWVDSQQSAQVEA